MIVTRRLSAKIKARACFAHSADLLLLLLVPQRGTTREDEGGNTGQVGPDLGERQPGKLRFPWERRASPGR